MENLRNVALVSHGGAGKTSLTEAMLYNAGVTTRLGKIEEGTTVSDYDPEEIKRKISINATIIPCLWEGKRINIIDTPGYIDFVGEVKSSLRVVDGAIVVLSAVAGVEVQTENVWQYADEYKLPRLIFINKMDQENAQFYKVLASAQKSLSSFSIAVHLPLGEGEKFKGVVDLIRMKAYSFNNGELKEEEIPADLKSQAESYREKLVEAVAETDDKLIEKYLENGKLSVEEIKFGLKTGMLKGKLIPVVCGSAFKNIGIPPFLNLIGECFPSPLDRGKVSGINPQNKNQEIRKPEPKAPFSAFVFKTISEPHIGDLTLFRIYSGTLSSGSSAYNSAKGNTERIGQLVFLKGKGKEEITEAFPGDIVAVAKLKNTSTGDTLCDSKYPIILNPISFPEPVFSVAVKPKAQKDQEKLGVSLAKFAEIDPTFKMQMAHEFGETVVSGIGELHIEVILDRLKSRFGIEVNLDKPKVAYRETVHSSAQGQGKYKKQSGGRGQYGDVWLRIEPLPTGKGFEFVNKIVGGSIPSRFIPAVEKGVRDTIAKGILAGYPIIDIKVTLYDGSFHAVDSSDMAFQIAGSLAFKKVFLGTNPVLLEPVMSVEITTPEEYMGDINSDLSARRGTITGMESKGNNQKVTANVPLSQMYKYSTDLRSITQGTGVYTMKFSHYEEVPAQISAKIISEVKNDGSGKL